MGIKIRPLQASEFMYPIFVIAFAHTRMAQHSCWHLRVLRYYASIFDYQLNTFVCRLCTSVNFFALRSLQLQHTSAPTDLALLLRHCKQDRYRPDWNCNRATTVRSALCTRTWCPPAN